MGIAIRYCDKCRIRISPGDLESGKALEMGNRAYCPECAKDVAPQSTPDTRKKSTPPRSRKATRPHRRARNPLVDSNLFNPFQKLPKDSEPLRPPPSPPKNHTRKPGPMKTAPPTGRRHAPSARKSTPPATKPFPLLAVGAVCAGVGALVILIAVVMFAGRSGGSAQVPKRTKKPATIIRNGEKVKKLQEAEKAWKEALAFYQEKPDQWVEAKAGFEKALPLCMGTPFEAKIRKVLEEGQQKAETSGERMYQQYAEGVENSLAVRDFDKAIGSFEGFKGSQEWIEKAIALRQRAVEGKRLWELARRYPGGKKLSPNNLAAIRCLLCESNFALAPAMKGDDLPGWVRKGSAEWSVTGGELTGTAKGEGTGQILFGEVSWVDYVFTFECRIEKGPGFEILIHADKSENTIRLTEEKTKFQTGRWYRVYAVIWGDFAVVFIYDRLKCVYSTNTLGANRSVRGGFGFRIPREGTVRFREIHFRRLDLPGRPYNPLPEGWHPFARKGETVVGLTWRTDREESNRWQMREGILSGSTQCGNFYMQIGSPSWTAFEAKFSLRKLKKTLRIEVHRPVGNEGLIRGTYERAHLTIPESAASGNAWLDGHIVVGKSDIVLTLAGKTMGNASFTSHNSEKLLQPLRFGFLQDQAGGAVEFRDLQVRVTSRREGF
ncbi:MAG: hypothetical protein ACYTHN_20700 [Planctomycetota bacterium]